MTEKRFRITTTPKSQSVAFDEKQKKHYIGIDLEDLLNEQQELIEELEVSDEMGWKRAEYLEKKCPKELHNKKMYIKRLEYKVQKFKEENEQLKKQLESRTASDKYHQRMLTKWLCKNE